MAKDYYQILGIQRGASPEEIKKAYRNMSKELHPDKHKGDKAAEQKFKEVNEAYEILSNPQKKQMFDQFGEAGTNGNAGPGAGGGGFGGFDFNGFSGGSADFSDIFEGFFGGASSGSARARQDEKGRDLEVNISIDFMESVTGARRTLQIRKQKECEVCKGSGTEPGTHTKTCPECSGTGQVTRTAQSFFGLIQQRVLCPRCNGSGKVPEKPCHKCNGEGRYSANVEVDVNIPAGIADGQTLRMRGEGDAGRQGAAAGDLYVHIHVRPDKRFDREGDDIRSINDISVLDALLGTELEVETVQGTSKVKIPEGTQPGQVFRLKDKGMPQLNGSRHGDHYVTVNVKVPTKLSRHERKLLEEWRKL
ncbi:MAG: molecular chaperone DnaJ [Candidatus Peribacteria bacterium]|nr:molecular chaperone DnaJ [Candidatus Peribacteria bacterium]